MSAKLFKSLAEGSCNVVNRISGEVIIYWTDSNAKVRNLVIKPDRKPVNLLEFATIAQLRSSPNLKKLVNEGSLSIV